MADSMGSARSRYLPAGVLLILAGAALFLVNLALLSGSTGNPAEWLYGAPVGILLIVLGSWYLHHALESPSRTAASASERRRT